MNRTIKYFREISRIPRESGNEKAIADYLVSFAKKRKLEYLRDDYNNIIIIKKVNNKEPIILQAHMDMVCESNIEYDFSKNGIIVIEEDGYLKSQNTTLGADNGIGVAEILNLLDNYNYSIEAIFTVSEETSMIGAEKINISSLKGKKLINLDGFNENIIINESASFNDIIIKTNYKKSILPNGYIYKMSLLDLPGGHSGSEIDKNIPNSIIELARMLDKIDDISINTFQGGTKFNVIPSTALCVFSTKLDLIKLKKGIKSKYNANIKIEKIEENCDSFLDNDESKRLLNSITNFKNGVVNKEDGLVTTSHNLGVIDLDNNEIKIGLRSSRINEENKDIKYIKNWTYLYDYKYVLLGRQPGFRTRKNCSLINDLIKCNSNARVCGVHVSLELGFIQEKNNDIEIAVISPQINGAHTIYERVSIESINNFHKWLVDYIDSMENN